MSAESPEAGEDIESHPLYKPLKHRCLVLVDKNGEALDSDEKMRTEGLPELAIIYAIDENSEDLRLWRQNCKQFEFVDPALLTGDASEKLIVMKNLESTHIEQLVFAYENFNMLNENIGLAFARLQVLQVKDEKYKKFYPRVKLPKPGTSARMLLDRVKLTKNLVLTGYNDRSADCILYTGGDFPKPYAYEMMEDQARSGGIEIIKPHQLVYGLTTGALARATSKLRKEISSGLADYIREHIDWLSFAEMPSATQQVFYFKGKT